MGEPKFSRIYKAVPIFRSLSEGELREILGVSRLFRVKKDTVVMREGTASDGMYIIVEGEAHVRLRLFQGDQTRLATLGVGDVFGEMSLIDREPRSATVVMTTPGVLYHVDAEGFDRLRAELRPSAFKVIREIAPIMCSRLREMNKRVGQLFAAPGRSMAVLEKRYLAGSYHAGPTGAGSRGRGGGRNLG